MTQQVVTILMSPVERDATLRVLQAGIGELANTIDMCNHNNSKNKITEGRYEEIKQTALAEQLLLLQAMKSLTS